MSNLICVQVQSTFLSPDLTGWEETKTFMSQGTVLKKMEEKVASDEIKWSDNGLLHTIGIILALRF